MEARDKVALLVFVSVLLIASVSLSVWRISKNGSSDLSADAAASRTEIISNLYQFQDMYMPKADLSEVNACAVGNGVVECADNACSNCVCPEECEVRGMQYMMMDMQGDSSYRCSCADTLEELVDSSAWQDYTALGDTKNRGDVWKSVNSWENWLLPADGDTESDRFKYGVGGLYPFGHIEWGANALNKVYIGSTSVGSLAAVYKRGKKSTQEPSQDLEDDELVETGEPLTTESAAPE